MKNIFMVFTYLLFVIFKGVRTGGMKALINENLLLKQQLALLTRSRKRAPNLSPHDRFLPGLWTIFLHPRHLQRVAILIHPWQANLRIPGIQEVKTIPDVPVSHPFIERLIGTIRREYLDHLLFWNESDLARKLEDFKAYYNGVRLHQSLNQQTPEEAAGKGQPPFTDPKIFVWQSHCQGLFQKPIAA